ncbi:hypothetical protein GC088_03460 [Arthrobacter sp. JZ12]|uniref:hypothetical protein n=1 Tax=Arthrobacter sp. JZ12 TaxID=2654190 RepID=UPI002B49EFFE|nr:hypothetical protein [Arthrobacter sp. JZ12]WRH24241.1 hypothetical protein GC088_03460 [Arthrobacter sp. JZ12]
MRPPLRGIVITTAGLGLALIQAIEGLRFLRDTQYLSLLLLVFGILAAAASLKLWRNYCFGCRIVLALISVATVIGHLLSLTVGLPGTVADAWMGSNAVLGVISVALGLLIMVLLLPRFFHPRPDTNARPPV